MDERYAAHTAVGAGVLEWDWARRELGFSISEWEGLPWWHRKAYLDAAEYRMTVQECVAAGMTPPPFDDAAEAVPPDEETEILAGIGLVAQKVQFG